MPRPLVQRVPHPSLRDPWLVLTWAVALAMFAFMCAAAFEPLRLNWGDPWSDVDIRIAGRFFARYGFLKTRFAGIVDVQPLTPDSYRYLHYPPLGMLINGVLQTVFKTEHLPLFRLVALGFSAAGVAFFFKLVRAIWGHRAACFATIVLVTNALWVKYADCIYSHPLHLSFGFASLYYLTQWFSFGKHRHLLLSGAGAFLCFFSSYDFFFFVPIFVVLTPALVGQPVLGRKSLKATSVVAAFCLASLALKCLLAVWAIGWTAFAEDVRLQFFERATPAYSFDYRSSLPRLTYERLLHFFSPTIFVLLGVYLFATVARLVGRPARSLPPPSPLVLLVAGVPFVVAMNQLFAEQYHPSLSFLPFSAVGVAVLVEPLFARPGNLGRACGAVALAVPIAWGVTDLARSHKSFLTDDELERVGSYLAAEDKNPYLYSNSVFSAAFRYSFNRQLFRTNHLAPDQFIAEVLRNFDDLGERPVHYIQFDDIDHATIDCKAQSYMSVAFGRREWLEDPWTSEKDWMPAVRKQDAEALAQVREVGVPVFDAGRLHVYRVEPARVRSALARRRPPVTEMVRFGDPESSVYLLQGFRPQEHAEIGDFRWLRDLGTRKRPVLTAYGLFLVATEHQARLPEMEIDLPAGHDYRLELSGWSAVEGQDLDVFVNDAGPAGRFHYERTFDPKSFSFDVAADRLRPSGRQSLTFAFGRASPVGVGVGFFWLKVTALPPRAP